MSAAVYLNELGIVCALGAGREAVAVALFAEDAAHGVAPTDACLPGRTLHLGRVDAPLPTLEQAPPEQRSRNNALLGCALDQIRGAAAAAIDRHGPHRVAVVLGTSTSGIAEGGAAVRHHTRHGRWPTDFRYAQQEMGSPSAFVARELGAGGPAYVISTACSSSAKALTAGARLLRAGIVDVVIAGGADSLCAFTVAGFSALESVDAGRCNPLSVNRRGINIGEGAALFVMSREPGPVRLAGWGETSDAHHMSAPDPSGRGAAAAMHEALARAGVAGAAVDYVNLHGTATPQNDAMEARCVAEMLGLDMPVSSTKPLTGHTLGGAGAIEAGLCWLTLAQNPQGRIPPHWWDGERDPGLPPLRVAAPGERFVRAPDYLLSHSFAFGGSNAVLLFGRG